MIIPLGYKVHSQNGIMFRKWANSVLNELTFDFSILIKHKKNDE